MSKTLYATQDGADFHMYDSPMLGKPHATWTYKVERVSEDNTPSALRARIAFKRQARLAGWEIIMLELPVEEA